jgi:hypothetical protein
MAVPRSPSLARDAYNPDCCLPRTQGVLYREPSFLRSLHKGKQGRELYYGWGVCHAQRGSNDIHLTDHSCAMAGCHGHLQSESGPSWLLHGPAGQL